MLVKIIKVWALEAHEYTDRNGKNQVFKSKGFTMQTGEGSFYAEAVGDNAEALDKLGIQAEDTAFVQVSIRAREYKSQNGTERVSNEITIQQMYMV